MKFKSLAVAAAIAVACGSSFALDGPGTVGAQLQFYVSGSTALQSVFTNLVQNNTTSFNLYKGRLGSAAASLTDNADGQSETIYSGLISTNIFGSANNGKTIAIYLSTFGGSAFGVFPVATNSTVKYGDATTIGATTPTTFDGIVLHTSDAGLSDLDPVAFNDPVNHPIDAVTRVDLFPGASVTKSQFGSSFVVAAQTFGLAVNSKLYADLQADQGLSGSQVPSISAAAFNSIYSPGYSTNAPQPSDWTPLFTNGGGTPGNQVNICSRLPGSGTRASANAFFRQLPFNKLGQPFADPTVDNTGAPATISQNNPGTYVIVEHDNTAAVLGCVTAATPNNGYAIGIASTDRDLSTSDAKFVLLDNKTPNASASKFGKYDWIYEAYYQTNKLSPNLTLATTFGNQFKTPAVINLLSAASKNGILAAVQNCAFPYTGINATICSHVTRGGDSRGVLVYAK